MSRGKQKCDKARIHIQGGAWSDSCYPTSLISIILEVFDCGFHGNTLLLEVSLCVEDISFQTVAPVGMQKLLDLAAHDRLLIFQSRT